MKLSQLAIVGQFDPELDLSQGIIRDLEVYPSPREKKTKKRDRVLTYVKAVSLNKGEYGENEATPIFKPYERHR